MANAVSLYCIIVTTIIPYIERLVVTHDGNMIFNESGNNGSSLSSDGTTAITYTDTSIRLYISLLRCDHDGIYTFSVNSVLQANTTLVTTSKSVM